MSISRRILERPWMIALVATGIVAVVALNLWTFRQDTQRRYGARADLRRNALAEAEPVSYLLEAVGVESGEAAAPYAGAEGFLWPSQARDPFEAHQPFVAAPKALPEEGAQRRCDAIILRGSDLTALIDGAPYRVGETVGGARVLSIDREGVVLLQDEETLRLPVAGHLEERAVTVLTESQDIEAETEAGSQDFGDNGGKQ